MLKKLCLKNAVITIDAMGTQKKIAEQIIKQEADYVLALKDNQKTLCQDTVLLFDELISDINPEEKELLKQQKRYHRTLDNSHGRMEIREYYVIHDIEYIKQNHHFKGLSCLGMCVSRRQVGDKTTVNYHYDICSIEHCTAEAYAQYKRGHWSVENGLHWVLDVAFREDLSRIRKGSGAENVSVFRHLATSLLKQEPSKLGIAAKRKKCGWDKTFLFKVLGIDLTGINR